MRVFLIIMLGSGILLIYFGSLFYYQFSEEGFADDWVEFAFISSLASFLIFLTLTIITGGFKIYIEKTGPDYVALNEQIREVIDYTNEDISQNSDKFKNEWIKSTVEKVDKYNSYLRSIYNDYKFYHIEIPDKLTTYQYMEYNYYEKKVYWEDGTLVT